MTILFIISFVSLQLSFNHVKVKIDIIARSLYQRHKQTVDEQIEFQEYLLMFVHDLKLPIQNLKLVADETSQVEVKKLQELTDNLLNYSKISFKNIDLNIAQINIKDVIEDIIKSNFDLMIDKQIKLNYNSKNYILSSDQQWLSFIIKQLINNAIKYCDNYIEINFDYNQDQFKVIIENDGDVIEKMRW